jgi:hypothetical protein
MIKYVLNCLSHVVSGKEFRVQSLMDRVIGLTSH